MCIDGRYIMCIDGRYIILCRYIILYVLMVDTCYVDT